MVVPALASTQESLTESRDILVWRERSRMIPSPIAPPVMPFPLPRRVMGVLMRLAYFTR